MLEPGDVQIDVASGVATLPGQWSVARVGRLCRRRGYLLPLPRPLPGCSVAALCAQLPYIVDAYVTGVQATLPSGATVRAPHSPRGAVGPDLLGLICEQATAASVHHVALRVIASAEATLDERCYDSIDDAAATMVARVAEGRAFAVVAYRATAGVLVRCLGGHGLPAVHVASLDVARRWAWGRGGGRSARNLRPGDRDAVAETLSKGELVHAAPFVGRIAAISVSTWPIIESEPWGLASLWASRESSHE